MSAFAMLAALPESYSLLASTLYASSSLSSEHVLNAINLEWRRRHQSQETNAAAGYLAKTTKKPTPDKKGGRSTRTGKDGKPQLGPNANEYCDEHQAYGHSTDKCFRRKNLKQAAVATAQAEVEPQMTAQLAKVEVATESATSDNGMVANFLATAEPAGDRLLPILLERRSSRLLATEKRSEASLSRF
jgi:hypothetical protein